MDITTPRADLRTAQNRMLSFVVTGVQEQQPYIDSLLNSPDKVLKLSARVRDQLWVLFRLDKNTPYHIGITDSGKRTIENLVQLLCPAEECKNGVVATENYVAFHKFSAAHGLRTLKAVECDRSFPLHMGEILTRENSQAMQRAEKILRQSSLATLWIAWNSTSTGVQEQVDRLVRLRNSCNSSTLIVCDCASLPLFSDRWPEGSALPDAFFFSLRKQGLPYDGPQDEANQAKNSGGLLLFNERARIRAQQLEASPLYDQPTLENFVRGEITTGENRRNHISHLIKLDIGLSTFLADGRTQLRQQDRERDEIRRMVLQAFAKDGLIGETGFSLLAQPEYQSRTSYIIHTPQHIEPKNIIRRLKEQGILVSPSIHPELPGKSYLRFACYPGNTRGEIQLLLDTLAASVH